MIAGGRPGSYVMFIPIVVLAFAINAVAQTDSASTARTPSSVAEQAGAPADSAATRTSRQSKKGEGWKVQWNPYPSLSFGDRTRIDFRLRYKWDEGESGITATDRPASSVDLASRRVGIDGRVAGLFDFQIERELGDDEPWRDLFVGYTQFKAMQVQAGKFKLPFGLDENTGAANLDFINRSLAANQLSPGRDQGVMVHGRVIQRFIQYELGVFDHDGRHARTNNSARVYGGNTVAGRVTVRPFRPSRGAAADFQLGVAFTTSDVPFGLPSLRGESVLGETFYTSDQYVQGLRRRTGLEARWRPGPFSLKAEYIRVTTERIGQSVEDTDLPPLVATGWYLSGTWAITGEKKARGLEVPRHSLFHGGYGALEAAFRLEQLTFASAGRGEAASTGPRAAVVLGNADRAVTAGINWYVNRWVKVQWNVIHERVADPSQTRVPLPTWSRVLRVQFSL